MRNGGTHEYQIQQWFLEAFGRENLVADDPPLVAVNANSGDPHYALLPETSRPIREGDFVLLDVWAKKNTPGAVYYDITWTGFVGRSPSDRMREIFEIVRQARDIGVKAVVEGVGSGKALAGGQVIAVPEALYPRLEQSGVVLSAARDPRLARDYLAFLTCEKGRAILAEFGYGLP